SDVTLSNTEGVWLFGGGGNDTLWAAGSTATGGPFTVNILDADGGAGNDTIASGAGDDALAGNANTANGDTLDYSGATTGVNVNTAGGVATGMGSDTISGFENFVGSAFNDAFTGSGADEFF